MVADIAWLDRHGRGLTTDEWESGPSDVLAGFLNGAQVAPSARCGEHFDDILMLVFNTVIHLVDLTLSDATYAPAWQLALATAPGELPDRVAASAALPVPPASVTVLMHGRST